MRISLQKNSGSCTNGATWRGIRWRIRWPRRRTFRDMTTSVRGRRYIQFGAWSLRSLRHMPNSVHSHFGICNSPLLSVWSPHEVKPIHQLEMVQRHAARWTLNRHHNTSSLKGMLEDLQWRTLEQRPTDCRLVLLFQIIHGLVQIPPTNYLQPSLNTTCIPQKPQLYVSTMLDKNQLFLIFLLPLHHSGMEQPALPARKFSQCNII